MTPENRKPEATVARWVALNIIAQLLVKHENKSTAEAIKTAGCWLDASTIPTKQP